MLYLKFLFSLTLTHITFIQAGIVPIKLFPGIEGHVDRFDAQCRGRNVPQKSFFQGVKLESAKLFIQNYTYIVKEGGFKKLSATMIIQRCRFKENLDTCEEYFRQPNLDYCMAINPDNIVSKNSPFFIPFEPPVKCPIKKGVYQAYNVTIDLSPFLFFKLDGWYWKARYDLYSEHNRLVFCMILEGYVTKSKSKTN